MPRITVMRWSEILRRHAAALLRDLAAELHKPACTGPPGVPVGYAIGLHEVTGDPDPYRSEHGTCRNCGQPVQQLMRDTEVAVAWTHASADDRLIGGYGSRGCRAASFDGTRRDESLSRGWLAEPAR